MESANTDVQEIDNQHNVAMAQQAISYLLKQYGGVFVKLSLSTKNLSFKVAKITFFNKTVERLWINDLVSFQPLAWLIKHDVYGHEVRKPKL